jgi:Tfp pilus assembly protein PilF
MHGAIQAFEAAVQLAPDDPNTHLVLAYAYRHTGQRDRAIAAFEAALALDPDRPAARRALEELKLTNGD